ncbi:hypothetical protein [Actinomadura parmotrematis]|uniref:Uncharacterized protein n=1 Tax=Actinomadura parmotrematis TaxID=2864039 RepID=A0ABS7G2F6_9ACTN|nr:hypothetical protein [Actinomadura parmotrematis]MBW8486907.1 hypothetical protein [Actinomadura parmotrematis]
MRSISRSAAVALSATAALMAAPSLAHADAEYRSSSMKADAHGSTLHIRRVFAGDDGEVRYEDSYYTSGPDGASVRHVYSRAH